MSKAVDLIKAKGGKVIKEPGPVSDANTVIAFIEDPDGYKFKLVERGLTPEPLCQVMLRVGDLGCSINFYEKVSLNNLIWFSYEVYFGLLFIHGNFTLFF